MEWPAILFAPQTNTVFVLLDTKLHNAHQMHSPPSRPGSAIHAQLEPSKGQDDLPWVSTLS